MNLSLTDFEDTTESVTMFLTNGVKLNGTIVGLDTDGSYLLQGQGTTQKVFKHAVASIMCAIQEPNYERRKSQRGGR
jgi:RNA chaperone Hfq